MQRQTYTGPEPRVDNETTYAKAQVAVVRTIDITFIKDFPLECSLHCNHLGVRPTDKHWKCMAFDHNSALHHTHVPLRCQACLAATKTSYFREVDRMKAARRPEYLVGAKGEDAALVPCPSDCPRLHVDAVPETLTGKCAAYCGQYNRRPARLELLIDGTPANRIPDNADVVSYTRGTETACDYWDRNCEDIYADACVTEQAEADVADDVSGLDGDTIDPDPSWDVA